MTDKIFIIRMAGEPLWNDDGSRSDEHWVQLYKDKDGYHTEYGNDRGTIDTKDGNSMDAVSDRYWDRVETFDMKESSRKEVEDENKNLSLEDIVRFYFSEGNYIREGMDEALDVFKEETKVRCSYKNIWDGSHGFLAKVTLRKGTEKFIMLIDYDGTNPHMVRDIRCSL